MYADFFKRELHMKKIHDALVLLVGDILVAMMVTLVCMLVVRFTGIPSFANGAIIESPSGRWEWVSLEGVETFDPAIRRMNAFAPIVIGRAQLFFSGFFLTMMVIIPIVFVFIDRYVFAITLTAQLREGKRRRRIEISGEVAEPLGGDGPHGR